MLLVNLERPSPRARYIVRHVFERMLGWPVTFAASLEDFRSSRLPKLNYGARPADGAFNVTASGWLDTSGTPSVSPPLPKPGDRFEFFGDEPGFDPFSAGFFLLALCEEYTATMRDEHGRAQSAGLLPVSQDPERFPLIDRWALQMARQLRARFPELPEPRRKYAHVLTIDVDSGLKYRGRPLHRAIGASVKEVLAGDLRSFRERWRVRAGGAADPYIRGMDHIAAAAAHCDRTIVFFLVRGNGRFDHAADLGDPAFGELIRHAAAIAEVGLHPSYESSRLRGLHAAERSQLSKSLGRDVRVSRQHFLRWKLPDTLRTLNELGFTEDHSIGFSDRIGFRAGTCTPFPWYDLERDQETPLMLHPFATMDSALAEGMRCSPEQALKEMMAICDAVKEVKGTFISVWHDRYLSGHAQFATWPDVMHQLVQYART